MSSALSSAGSLQRCGRFSGDGDLGSQASKAADDELSASCASMATSGSMVHRLVSMKKAHLPSDPPPPEPPRSKQSPEASRIKQSPEAYNAQRVAKSVQSPPYQPTTTTTTTTSTIQSPPYRSTSQTPAYPSTTPTQSRAHRSTSPLPSLASRTTSRIRVISPDKVIAPASRTTSRIRMTSPLSMPRSLSPPRSRGPSRGPILLRETGPSQLRDTLILSQSSTTTAPVGQSVLLSTGDGSASKLQSVDPHPDMLLAEQRSNLAEQQSNLDWRINDLTRNIRRTEIIWADRLDAERQNWKESIDEMKRFAVTTIEASLSVDRARIDTAFRDLTNCQMEVKVLSQVTAEVGDEMKTMKMAMPGCIDDIQRVKKTTCDIKASMLQMTTVDSGQQSLIDDLRQGSDSVTGSPIAQPRQIADGIKMNDATTLVEPLSREMDVVDAVQREHSECLELVFREMAELRQKLDESAGADTPFLQVFLQQTRDELCASVDNERADRIQALAGIKREIEKWESLLRERTDIIVEGLAEIRGQHKILSDSSPSLGQRSPSQLEYAPSLEVLEAMQDGRNTQLVSRLDAEQGERRSSLRLMQNSIGDLQNTQKRNVEELETLRQQSQNLLRDFSSRRVDDELREVWDAMSGLKRDLKGQEVTLRTTTGQTMDNIGALTSNMEQVQVALENLQDTAAKVKSTQATFEERLEEVFEEVEAGKSGEKAVTGSTAAVWDSISSEKERLNVLSNQVDVLAGSLKGVVRDAAAGRAALVDVNRVQENLSQVVTDVMGQQLNATRRNVDAIVATQRELSRLPTFFTQGIAKEQERINVLEKRVENVRQECSKLQDPTLLAGLQQREDLLKISKHDGGRLMTSAIEGTLDKSVLSPNQDSPCGEYDHLHASPGEKASSVPMQTLGGQTDAILVNSSRAKEHCQEISTMLETYKARHNACNSSIGGDEVMLA